MYDVMLLGRLYEKDVFLQVSQMFVELKLAVRTLPVLFL